MKTWAADPHKFGPGKVHGIDPEKPLQTYCGKIMSAYPGKPVSGREVSCQICAAAPGKREANKQRSEESRFRWEAEQRLREIKKAEYDAARWARYNAYLRSPQWREISQRVLNRAQRVCDGCGKEPATQAHHLTYENVGAEFLWELRAVCNACHDRYHAAKSARSTQ